MEVILRVVLAVGLLCWGSEGQVTCRNENGEAVDWYILYKKPNSFELLYIDPEIKKFNEASKDINHQNGFLARTLQPIFTDNDKKPTCGYFAYSDQPPKTSTKSKRSTHKKKQYGHSKGLVMGDKDTVVWLLHSTPKFPETTERNKFFPKSGKTNAQTFICVTFKHSELNKIETHLLHIRAKIFKSANTGVFSKNMEDLKENIKGITYEDINNKKKLYQDLTSKNGQNFKSIFKKISDKEEVGDLYVTIAETFKSNVFAQTWGCQKGKYDSFCPEKRHSVFNIESVSTWKRTVDHSKWCVTEDGDWTCIADSNRSKSQSERPGGALCFENKDVREAFFNLKITPKDCSYTSPASDCSESDDSYFSDDSDDGS